jgi:hypothetical protein
VAAAGGLEGLRRIASVLLKETTPRRFDDAAGMCGFDHSEMVSEPITLEVIPEPSTLLLVAGGLALIARRRPRA